MTEMPAADTTRIVHIDPDPQYRLLVRLALDPEPDLSVAESAGDLPSGLDAVRRHSPDLVMVEPHGAVRDLAELEAQVPRARIIVLTSLPAGEIEQPAPGGSARGHLSKRVRPTQLAGEIRDLAQVLAVVGDALDEARTELDADLISPRRAREFVTSTMQRWNCQDATAIIDLLVSEIVANAVTHAATACELTVQLLDQRVRVAVVDYDTSHPKRRPDDPLSRNGRGIALIEQLSLAWGVDRLPAGKRVWFETPRPEEAGT